MEAQQERSKNSSPPKASKIPRPVGSNGATPKTKVSPPSSTKAPSSNGPIKKPARTTVPVASKTAEEDEIDEFEEEERKLLAMESQVCRFARLMR